VLFVERGQGRYSCRRNQLGFSLLLLLSFFTAKRIARQEPMLPVIPAPLLSLREPDEHFSLNA